MSVDATTTVSTPADSAARSRFQLPCRFVSTNSSGIVLGPVDVLERGEVEDEVGPRAAELGLQTRGLADVAEDVRDPLERLGRATAAVGDQRALVAVEQRDVLGPEAGEEGARARARSTRRRR